MDSAERARILVGRRISELRQANNETQAVMAEAVGVSTTYLRNVENGQKNLTIKSMAKYAEHLGVEVADLFTKPQSIQPVKGRPPKKKSQ